MDDGTELSERLFAAEGDAETLSEKADLRVCAGAEALLDRFPASGHCDIAFALQGLGHAAQNIELDLRVRGLIEELHESVHTAIRRGNGYREMRNRNWNAELVQDETSKPIEGIHVD